MNGGAGDMPAMEVFGDQGSYRLRLVCEPGRYDAGYLAAFTERMRVIAENFAAVDAACPIRDIPVLSPEETTTALQQSYGGDLAYDTSLTFVTLFRQQAAVRTANRRLCEQNEAQMFVTVWAGVIDKTTGVLEFVNAGHNRPFIRRTDGTVERVDETSGLFLGMFPDADYTKHTRTLAPGDALLLFTDGVTEAMNPSRKLYGEERLILTLAEILPTQDASSPATELVAAVETDVRTFTAGAEQSDDLTLLALVLRGTI